MGFFTNLFKSKQKAPVIETSAKQNVEIKNEVMQKNLQNAVELDIDLVEASYFRGCCGECAKYRGRWFSISGKDKRFPKMPVDYGCTCMGIDFSPVIFGLSEPMLSDEIDDVITYSNRPFVDDRNDEELEIFNTDRKRLENEEFYEPYKEHWEAIRKYDHQQYDRLCQELPQLAPKSYSGYMAKAKQLPSGSWRVHIYDGELKKQISFTSNLPGKAGKAEAELMAQEYLLGRRQKQELGRTVGECIDEYISLKENILSPTTIEGYRKEKRNSLAELCDVPVKELTPMMIQAHINRLALSKSPKTIRNAHGLLVSVLNVYAPDMRINTTLPKQQKKIKQLPHVEDVMRAVVGTDIELPCLLALWCSLRMSEIRGAKKSDITGGVLTVRDTVVMVDGVHIEKHSTKTIESTRQIRLPERIQRLVSALPAEQEYLCTLSGQALYKRFSRLLEREGIPHMSFHDLRHMNASVMLALNVPDKYAMERGGWSTNNIMKSVYQHTFSAERKAVDDRIDDYFTGIYDTIYDTNQI